MIIETLFFIFVGVFIGLCAGLVPAMHVNTFIPFLFSIFMLFQLDFHYLAVLIVSVAVSEIFLNFLPSIFIGAPDESTALSVLPGHKLLLEGNGYEAIKLAIIGSIGSLILSLILISFLSPFFKYFYKISRQYLHFVLSFVIIFMIFSERNLRKMFFALLITFLSGLLGIFVLNSSLISKDNILFPILTGFFGISTLMTSIFKKAKIPKQNENSDLKISKSEIFKSIILGSIAGIIVGFLPAIGISEAATMVQYLGGRSEARSFLITLGGINVGNEVFSLISLYLVGNPRSGASVAMQRIFGKLTFYDVLLLIGVICLVSGISAPLTLFLGRKIPKYLEKINYRKLCFLLITFIAFEIFFITGPLGLLIAFTSASIGLLCIYLRVKRSHCINVLIIPTILFFAGLNPAISSFLNLN